MMQGLKKSFWYRSGTPWIWLNAGALAFCMLMMLALLLMISLRGLAHFWPQPVFQFEIINSDAEKSTVIGEKVKTEQVAASILRDQNIALVGDAVQFERYLIREGNRDITLRDFNWYLAIHTQNWQRPNDIVVLQRRQWGPFYGRVLALQEHDIVVSEHGQALADLPARIERAHQLFKQRNALEQQGVGALHEELSALQHISAQSDHPPAWVKLKQTTLTAEFAALYQKVDQLQEALQRDSVLMRTANGEAVVINLADIVSATLPNQQNLVEKLATFFGNIGSFLSTAPSEANTEGGILPAIVGTVVMVMLMSVLVTPLGILAAVYLHDYAKQGVFVRIVRLAVYNLAGVPSIVFGVFGLGFFVYIVGGGIDKVFFSQQLPSPTFGTPGLFWASLTLALLTLPVVVVSTEEGLARIPKSLRMGSMALGATRSETLWKVVMPLTVPAMLTGLILAVARACGEVAPLILVGVVKLAPSLPVNNEYPYLHLEQKFMHLGFHIFDAAYQSPNVEAAMSLVYATALVLILLILMLNTAAIILRNRLRAKYHLHTD